MRPKRVKSDLTPSILNPADDDDELAASHRLRTYTFYIKISVQNLWGLFTMFLHTTFHLVLVTDM